MLFLGLHYGRGARGRRGFLSWFALPGWGRGNRSDHVSFFFNISCFVLTGKG